MFRFTFLFSLMILSGIALGDCVVNSCKNINFKNDNTLSLFPIKKYRLSIKINRSYKNTYVYLNDDKLKSKTNGRGFLNFTIPLRDKGKQCVKIKDKSFEFHLYKDMSLVCSGIKKFCCKIVDDD